MGHRPNPSALGLQCVLPQIGNLESEADLSCEALPSIMELKRVALIAHDGKKNDLMAFVERHKDWLCVVNWSALARPVDALRRWG